MTTYHPGQRVTLTHLTTPDAGLQAGDQGTVRQVGADQQTIAVDWDNGTHRTIRLGQGYRIEPLPAEPPTADAERTWDQLIADVRAFGVATGRAAADTWRQQTFGDPNTGEAKATARDTLTGIDDDDPDVLNGLPSFATRDGTVTPPAYAGLSALLAGDAIAWRPGSSVQWAPASEVFQDAYDTAARARVTEICRIIVSPTGDGRDLSHLHPDQVRLGSAGVFSGEWMLDDDGWRECYRIGFAGTLISRWNGWAVFSCTRQVADAIVADLEQVREAERARLRTAGVAEQDLDRQVNATLTDLRFDGDTLVADQRVMQDDEQAIERVDPDIEGRYEVMGRNWQWEAVDPNRCARIVGDLPDPDQRQQFVPLAHTLGMRLPHDRVNLTLLKHWPVQHSLAYVAALTLDGQRVGTVGNDGAGGGTDLVLSGPTFGVPSNCTSSSTGAATTANRSPGSGCWTPSPTRCTWARPSPRPSVTAGPSCVLSTPTATPLRCDRSSLRRKTCPHCCDWATNSPPSAPTASGRSGTAAPGSPCPAPPAGQPDLSRNPNRRRRCSPWPPDSTRASSTASCICP